MNPETLSDLQTFVDDLAGNPSFAQYVKQAKLGLIDSNFAPLDLALKAGVLKGYQPDLMAQVWGI